MVRCKGRLKLILNRFYWKCDKCHWEDTDRVSGSLGQTNREEDKRYCNCKPPIKHWPYAGKDTSM